MIRIGATLLLAFVAAAMLAPEWTRAAGLDFWNAGAAAANLAAADETDRELNAELEDSHRRTEVINHVIHLLIVGQIDLRAAVTQLEAIGRDWPKFTAALTVHFNDCSLREAFVRMALSHVVICIEDDPELLERVMLRLEVERRAMLGSLT